MLVQLESVQKELEKNRIPVGSRNRTQFLHQETDLCSTLDDEMEEFLLHRDVVERDRVEMGLAVDICLVVALDDLESCDLTQLHWLMNNIHYLH